VSETARLKAALELIENYDSSCECDDHTQPECCANVSVIDCFCAHCIAGKALVMTREEKAAEFIKQSGKTVHSSDCSTSIAPAEEPGPCDCDIVNEVFADKQSPNDWHVETIDEKTGDIYQAVFAGPNAERRAREYASRSETK
jgi:hypothetical protein